MKRANESFVFADWYMFEKPRLVGKLNSSSVRGKSIYSFEYDLEWIKTGISIDPELPLFSGIHYASSNDNFGVFKDSSPDRWGQLLMKRREVLLSKVSQTEPRTLSEMDFLLGVHDSHRMGGLRFKDSVEGEYLSNDNELAAPPWTSLRDLEYAVEHYEKNADLLDEDTLKWINQLISPGSSLGGARPKAAIIDTNGKQWIAKFPSTRDDYDLGLWEMIVHDLAVLAKIKVPKAVIKKLGSNYHTFLSQRFDRIEDNKRIHFTSAMTWLQHTDGDDYASGASYLEIVEFIKTNCVDVSSNLEELFRRILFSVCVSNTDDHLRNHGFLFTESGWVLSPAYDINTTVYGTGLTLNINEVTNSLEIELVMSTVPYYLLSVERAEEIKREVVGAVSKWREVAGKYTVGLGEIERMAKGFRY